MKEGDDYVHSTSRASLPVHATLSIQIGPGARSHPTRILALLQHLQPLLRFQQAGVVGVQAHRLRLREAEAQKQLHLLIHAGGARIVIDLLLDRLLGQDGVRGAGARRAVGWLPTCPLPGHDGNCPPVLRAAWGEISEGAGGRKDGGWRKGGEEGRAGGRERPRRPRQVSSQQEGGKWVVAGRDRRADRRTGERDGRSSG